MSVVVVRTSPLILKRVLARMQMRTAFCALFTLLLVILFGGLTVQPLSAQEPLNYQYDIKPPAGASERFGSGVTVLSNGNVVITDPGFDLGAATNVGAVYLYSGSSLSSAPYNPQLISRLTGSTTNDSIGTYVMEVGNSNFVVGSKNWDRGGIADAGAVTWVDGVSGLDGVVSASNSLVGSVAEDLAGVIAFKLPNGNYVAVSPLWDNGAAEDAGAITWANGNTGIVGEISSANSLVANVGQSFLGTRLDYQTSTLNLVHTILTNGNVVVSSPEWNSYTGAATWISGTSGRTGVVGASNSIVGHDPLNRVGYGGVTALANGNYVVNSTDLSIGGSHHVAFTWGNGSTGTAVVADGNSSIYGEAATNVDWVGGSIALANGDYVVAIPGWSFRRGAVRWGDGDGGTVGAVDASNSLVGDLSGDQVGSGGLVALPVNGNYVVVSPRWQNAGAVTWASGVSGITGSISGANSLIGNRVGDNLGVYGVLPLPSGNYVVRHYGFQDLTTDDGNNEGAVVWVDGDVGLTGNVTYANSLHGSPRYDLVGSGGVYVLSSGDYVVSSPYWNGSRGAVTWADGETGLVGEVTTTNSFVGANELESVSGKEVLALTNGNFVIASAGFSNDWITLLNGNGPSTGSPNAGNSLSTVDLSSYVGALFTPLSTGNFAIGYPNLPVGGVGNVGGAMWGSGNVSPVGTISEATAVVGNEEWDLVSYGGVYDLGNDLFAVYSKEASNGSAYNGGAVTLMSYNTRGRISAMNSVQSTSNEGGSSLSFDYDDTNDYLVVGRPADNRATVMILNVSGFVLLVSSSGTGKVTADSGGLNCPRNCMAGYPEGMSVVLTATPGNEATFTGWSGGVCSGTQSTCTISMDEVQNVTATFTSATHSVSITKAGAGTGVVSSNPAGISCGATCSFDFNAGDSVTLTAIPDTGVLFTGWSGDCTGVALTCTLIADADKSVTATFAPATGPTNFTLSVLRAGSGSGTVTSAPAGINCGADCSGTYANGTSVTLTAVASTGSTFTGWSGACSGTGTCVTSMNANKSATATFALQTDKTLTITKGGTGTGTITSSPAGINCGSTCSSSFANNAEVTLTATPATGSSFTGWSGACTGTSTSCTVELSANRSANATFTSNSGGTNVDVNLAPSNPAGGTIQVEVVSTEMLLINALNAASPSSLFPVGTVLKLTAVANDGFEFEGWTGDLTGTTNPATVTVEGALSIGATFTATDDENRVWLPRVSK